MTTHLYAVQTIETSPNFTRPQWDCYTNEECCCHWCINAECWLITAESIDQRFDTACEEIEKAYG